MRDTQTGKTVLLESWNLKFMETHVLDKQMSPGTHVAYNDGDRWQEGKVESNSAVGAALVRYVQVIIIQMGKRENWSYLQLKENAYL